MVPYGSGHHQPEYSEPLKAAPNGLQRAGTALPWVYFVLIAATLTALLLLAVDIRRSGDASPATVTSTSKADASAADQSDQAIYYWRGALMRPADPGVEEGADFSQPTGMLVAKVTPGSLAARAHLRAGDVIMALDGNNGA
jgi:S1-C subfamily serine protease